MLWVVSEKYWFLKSNDWSYQIFGTMCDAYITMKNNIYTSDNVHRYLFGFRHKTRCQTTVIITVPMIYLLLLKWFLNKKNSGETRLYLNKYETDCYFLQIFQSSASVCLIICAFCKNCEPICEPEIVLNIQTQ